MPDSEKGWGKRAVVYQIYPLSFYDTSGNGMGDLRGVIEKLDYLNDGTEESLGVDAIWLSPFYKSPMADWGYDVSDHTVVDPVFGEMGDFERLIDEAHKRGIKVIVDFVPNHTSSQHAWFIESRSSRDNPKRDWYTWADPGKNGGPPNNWISVFGGPAWTLDEKTGQYYLHNYLPEQPDLNWRNSEIVVSMQKILQFWLGKGVDGFRTDALSHLFEDENLTDEPPNPKYRPGKDNPFEALVHTYTRDQTDLVPSINNFCLVLGDDREKLMIGEMHFGSEADELVKFQQVCKNQLHLPFNFNLISLPWDARAYKAFIDEYDSKHGSQGWPNYVLGNHDQPRVATRVGDEQARVAAMLELTLRGTPFVYYGDEIGMKNTDISPEDVKDPFEKRVPGFGLGRDPERTPMQWSKESTAGFSKTSPWLPVNKNFNEVNVANQENKPASMLSLYKKLIWYRKSSYQLLKGDYLSAESNSPHAFVYARGSDKKMVLIALNFSNKLRTVVTNVDKKLGRVAITTYMDSREGEEVYPKSFKLRPNEGIIIELI